MAILARGGESYARLQFPAGPGGAVQLTMQMQWDQLPRFLHENRERLPQMIQQWQEELGRFVIPEPPVIRPEPRKQDPQSALMQEQQSRELIAQRRFGGEEEWFVDPDDLALLGEWEGLGYVL